MVRMLQHICLILCFSEPGFSKYAGKEPRLSLEPGNQIREYPLRKILDTSIDSPITPAILSYLEEACRHASEQNFDALLIRLNTPGGLLSTTREILTLIGESPIPVIVWVTPGGASATSAGAIISSGAHLLFMAEGSNIGAATPIMASGENLGKGDLKEKAINDLVALVQSLAGLWGRNGSLYKEMVINAASYTATEAKEKKIIDGLANSREELIFQLSEKTLTLQGQKLRLRPLQPLFDSFPMDTGQKLLNILADPNLSYILFILGACLLWLEMQAAGGFIAGSLGGLCLVLSGIGLHVIPVNFGAMGLILFGLIFLVLEAFIASFGILTISGIASLLAGSLFLFRTDEAYIGVSISLMIATALSLGLFVAAMGLFWFRDREKYRQPEDYYSLKGGRGSVIKALPEAKNGIYYYQVKIAGEVWNARSERRYRPGDPCSILGKKPGELLLLI